jgi:biopolymer transport protein ExbD
MTTARALTRLLLGVTAVLGGCRTTSPETPERDPSPGAVVVDVDQAGGVSVGGKAVDASKVADYLIGIGADRGAPVTVRAHAKMPYDRLAPILEQLRKAGYRKVGVAMKQ